MVIFQKTRYINGCEIIHIFDSPHILKCIRNNLLNNYLELDRVATTKEKYRKLINFDHIRKAYEMDCNTKSAHERELIQMHTHVERKKNAGETCVSSYKQKCGIVFAMTS